jgi:hypothetical protein
MIGRQRSPEQTMNKNGIQSNGLGYTSIEVSTRVWNLNSTAKLFFVGQFDWHRLHTSFDILCQNNLNSVSISVAKGI